MPVVAERAIVTAQGTAGKPAGDGYPRDYRDFRANALSGYQYPWRGESEDITLAIEAASYTAISRDSALGVIVDAPYRFEGRSFDVYKQPKSGDYVSLASLTSAGRQTPEGDGIFVADGNYCFAGANLSVMFPRALGYTTYYSAHVGGIGEKNKELFMPCNPIGGTNLNNDTYGGVSYEVALYNLVGRPLVR